MQKIILILIFTLFISGCTENSLLKSQMILNKKKGYYDEQEKLYKEKLELIEHEFGYVQEALLEQNKSEEKVVEAFERALIQKSGALARIYLYDNLKQRVLPVNGIGMSNRKLQDFKILSIKETDNESIFEVKNIMESGESYIIELIISRKEIEL